MNKDVVRKKLAGMAGLEPSTPGTTIRCSNQLSYTHRIYIRTGQR